MWIDFFKSLLDRFHGTILRYVATIVHRPLSRLLVLPAALMPFGDPALSSILGGVLNAFLSWIPVETIAAHQSKLSLIELCLIKRTLIIYLQWGWHTPLSKGQESHVISPPKDLGVDFRSNSFQNYFQKSSYTCATGSNVSPLTSRCFQRTMTFSPFFASTDQSKRATGIPVSVLRTCDMIVVVFREAS